MASIHNLYIEKTTIQKISVGLICLSLSPFFLCVCLLSLCPSQPPSSTTPPMDITPPRLKLMRRSTDRKSEFLRGLKDERNGDMGGNHSPGVPTEVRHTHTHTQSWHVTVLQWTLNAVNEPCLGSQGCTARILNDRECEACTTGVHSWERQPSEQENYIFLKNNTYGNLNITKPVNHSLQQRTNWSCKLT